MPEETTFEEMVAAEEGTATEPDTSTADPPAEPDVTAGDEPVGDEPTEDTPPDDGATGDEPDGDEKLLVDLMETGHDWLGKYESKEAAFEGLKNALNLVGQRNEDAQIAKTLRDRLGDEAFERLVAGTPAPTKEADEEQEIPPSVDDMLLAQQAAEQEGASPEVRQRAAKMLKAYQERLHRLASQPELVVAEAKIVKDLQARLDALEKTTTESSATAAESAWVGQHQADLYVNGTNDLTPLGKRTQGLLESDPDVQAVPDRINQLNLALRLARGSLPKPKKTRTVPKGANHQAGTNRGKDDLRTLEEQMDADLEADPDAFFAKWVGAAMEE
jgi:hypothetical protein